jgi:RsiW-degrading membrane proteinase PrsW (M82 family)
MIFAIVFAQLWGVIQLIVLGSLSRTVRVRTVIAAMAVGLYAVAPVAVILQKTWIGVAASLVGKSMADMTGIASYTVDPFLEEALKLLPLALLMLIPAIRRQWSRMDCVLIAAAIGSGFGLAEHMYRYASSPAAAQGVSGGWAMTFGRYTPMVPSVFNSLTSWLPNGVWFPEDPTRVNWHLAWSAIGGLALGLAVRNPKRAARITAGGLFLLIALDHAAGNAHDIGVTWLAILAGPLDLVTAHLGLLAFLAVVAALWLDRAAQPSAEALEPMLAAERSASPRIVGTFTAACRRLPWSISWVSGFDRARRAYHAAHAAAPESVNGMFEALVAERDRVEQKLVHPQAPPLVPLAWRPEALRNTLRQRPVIISLVLLAPSIFYLIIGGFPQTAWVQAVVTSGVIWPLVILITLGAQARLVLRVAGGARNLGKTSRLPIGDDAAILGLQLACGIGSVALGGFTLMRVFSGVSVGSTLLSHAHAADAANRLTPGSGVSV